MIYEYECNNCGETFDVWATLAEKEKGIKPVCPKCNSDDTYQVLGSVNVGISSKSGARGGVPPGCGTLSGAGCC